MAYRNTPVTVYSVLGEAEELSYTEYQTRHLKTVEVMSRVIVYHTHTHTHTHKHTPDPEISAWRLHGSAWHARRSVRRDPVIASARSRRLAVVSAGGLGQRAERWSGQGLQVSAGCSVRGCACEGSEYNIVRLLCSLVFPVDIFPCIYA